MTERAQMILEGNCQESNLLAGASDEFGRKPNARSSREVRSSCCPSTSRCRYCGTQAQEMDAILSNDFIVRPERFGGLLFHKPSSAMFFLNRDGFQLCRAYLAPDQDDKLDALASTYRLTRKELASIWYDLFGKVQARIKRLTTRSFRPRGLRLTGIASIRAVSIYPGFLLLGIVERLQFQLQLLRD